MHVVSSVSLPPAPLTTMDSPVALLAACFTTQSPILLRHLILPEAQAQVQAM